MPIQIAIEAIKYAALNVSYRKVGGLRFLKVGRLSLSFCVSRTYKPVKGC